VRWALESERLIVEGSSLLTALPFFVLGMAPTLPLDHPRGICSGTPGRLRNG
jgi:hypothetical protein